MVSRFLVTTALEETWPDANEPVLFLGEWCRLYSRKEVWKKLNAVVAPYHWDDRDKLHKDYLYLQGLYEQLLVELAERLNAIHGVNYSVRYWRIIVGPWFGWFIQVLFDRWIMLQQVVRDNDISGVQVIKHKQGEYVPNDMADFIRLSTGESWNELIYGQILAWMRTSVKLIEPSKSIAVAKKKTQTLSFISRLKRNLIKVASHISGVLCRNDEYFFISTYLPIKQHLILQLKLGQIPKLWQSATVPTAPIDFSMRQWELTTQENSADFSSLVRTLISKHIPIAYMEGYQNVGTLAENLPWPKRPNAIFTSISWSADDVFKVWAAGKVEYGIPLVIGQHGGNYGMALWNFNEDHQVAIADQFLTWGWINPKNEKVKAVGNFLGFGRKMFADKAGKGLLVEMTMPQNSYHMYSVPVAAGQWQSYFEDQCQFVEALPVELRDQLIVRLFPHNWGHSQTQRWQDHFPALQLDYGAQLMTCLMSKARLYISTYNATTYLESLSLNFPTIVFWNPKHWELRDSAIPYFEKLKSVGIFHETPESAAKHMVAVWDDVAAWWESAEVQSARLEFCKHYAHLPEQPLDIMEKLFREITTSSHAKN